ncbi:tripartite tricarboxylate transporter TctB family protein [Lacrimispora sp.]|uniref:tripartite tricarboxylate transporter TctB family protein n=1 Tax=Lacrimispora sp. TaxID=2719234 RepID=UPI0034608EEF
MKTKNFSELVVNMVIFIFGALLFVSAQSIEVGAAMGQGGDFMPKLCSALWLLISGLLVVTTVLDKCPREEGEKGNLKGFFLTLILLFLYVLLLEPVGFVITSIVYMFIQMMLFVPKELVNKKQLIVFTVVSVLLPVLVNLLFENVFYLILPAGILG